MNWRTGLPYGWWRNPDVWAGALIIPLLIIAMFLLGWWFS